MMIKRNLMMMFMILINYIMKSMRSMRSFQLIKMVRNWNFTYVWCLTTNWWRGRLWITNSMQWRWKKCFHEKNMNDWKFYIRISKRVENQFGQVISLFVEHTCHRISHNMQAKTWWFVKKFAHILRHHLDMKLMRLIVEYAER